VSATLALELEAVPCPLCGGRDIATLGWLGDVSLGVPGTFPLARCRGCGLLHQNPRVRDDDLPRAYPDNYPPHTRDAEMPRMLRRAGTAVRWAAIFTLKSYFTVNVSILEGQRIVRHGVYRVIRHPSYTGLLLRYLGFGLAFANWLSAALIFLPLCAATLYRIRVEEVALRERFGEEYLSYARATKRLIPGVY